MSSKFMVNREVKITADNSATPVTEAYSPLCADIVEIGEIDINKNNDTPTKPLNIHYEIYGSGSERMVFINAMRLGCKMWMPIINQCLKLGNYQCLIYDHRGTGASDTNAGLFSYTMPTLAIDLRKLMLALGWSKANIVGFSMGGMVALEFACSYPEMVATLTLGVTSAQATIPSFSILTNVICARFSKEKVRKFITGCLPKPLKKRSSLSTTEKSDHQFRFKYSTLPSIKKPKYKPPVSKWTLFMQVLAVLRHRVSPSRLQALGEAFPNKQILIIAAEDDCVVHPKNSVYLADRLGQKGVIYEIYQGADHHIQESKWERFVHSVDSMVSAYISRNKITTSGDISV